MVSGRTKSLSTKETKNSFLEKERKSLINYALFFEMSMSNSLKIYLLTFICFVAGTSEFVIVGVLDKIAEDIGISISMAGQLITVFAITAAIGTPIAIYRMRKINQKSVLLIALLTFTLGSLLMTVGKNFNLLLVARVIMALGMGVFNVLCFIVASELAPEHKKAGAVATVTVGYNAALIVGLPVGRIITDYFGWQSIFIGTSILSLLFIALLYKSLPSFPATKALPLKDQVRVFKRPIIVLSLAMSFFWILGYSSLYSYITPFLQSMSILEEDMFSIAFLAFGISTLIGNKSGGFLGDRFGVPNTIVTSMFAHFIILILLSLCIGIHPYLTVALLMVWATAAWLPGPLFRFSIMNLSHEAKSVILSIYNSTIQFGFATGAALGGLEIDTIGNSYLSWTAAFIVAISFVLTLLYRKKRSLGDIV